MKAFNKVSLLVGLVLLISLLSYNASQAQENADLPKREFRGAWLHVVGNQVIKTKTTDEVKAMFIKTLDSLKLAGCNAIIFQVRPQADAFYKSEIEPWSRFLTGEQGVAPDPFWDPLEFMVEESHKRGMELHAWCNPYRVTSNNREVLSKDHLYFKNPEIFRRYGKQLYFNPGEPASIEHTVKVMADIASRYDIDALHFDDYFYPYPEKFEEYHDDDAFAKYAKNQGFEYWQKGDWRRHNVEMLIKAINDTIKSIKPYLRFGISPFGVHKNKKDHPDGSETNSLSNYDQLFADVPAWAEKGYIDYIAPQLYWEIGHPRADYDILINWWNNKNYKGHLYIGQNISTFSIPDLQDTTTTQMARKFELERSLENVDGNIWWPGWTIQRNPFGFADSLINKYQSRPALIPAYTDLDSIAPSPVTEIRYKNNTIEWSVSPADEKDVMQKPLFFAVYRFAKNEIPDISKSSALVAITSSRSFDPASEDAGATDGCKYIITAIDRCWNESAPSDAVSYYMQRSNFYNARMLEFAKESAIGKNDIVFLGNSLIQGGKWETYFPEAAKRIAKKGGRIVNRGIIGDDALGIYARLNEIIKGKPKKIFFITGANDISHHLPVDTIAANIAAVVERIIAELPGTELYMHTLLPINESFGRYKNLAGQSKVFPELNAILKRLAEEKGVKIIDLYPNFAIEDESGNMVLKPELTKDGLHITQEGYDIWSALIKEYVK